MNTTIAGRIGMPTARARGANVLLQRLRVPLEAWSAKRRWLVMSIVAMIAFALGANAWLTADMSGLQASRHALSEAQRKLSEAEKAGAQLPSMRKDAIATPMPANWTSADDIRVISQLATRNDVTLLGVEPGLVTGSGLDAMRPLRVTAQADFDHIADFLEALASLPVLVVPEEVTLKRQRDSLQLNATLRSFSAIHPVQTAAHRSVRDDPDAFDPDEEIVFYDPFQPAVSTPAPEDALSSMRLVGLLADRLRGLALIETGDNAQTLEAGQQWGDERVAQVDASALTLAKRDGSLYSLTLAEVVE
ncbi:type 4a pilus biogenesis protein PilO [Paraburkholderia sp. C35]|uniref:type 4a pilus biogenesis protein PilO n=1 Tax=Paraburkholderia sp. C35 TaxID=2126993 RepID=UPI000D6992E9|nr:type 4a pilus biogenesis protein PilO [Paraburkholderia sp. C35]